MTVRFQADADLNAEIVAGVLRREPGIDFQMADEANLRRLRDPEVLALAAQESRIVVTHDRRKPAGSQRPTPAGISVGSQPASSLSLLCPTRRCGVPGAAGQMQHALAFQARVAVWP